MLLICKWLVVVGDVALLCWCCWCCFLDAVLRLPCAALPAQVHQIAPPSKKRSGDTDRASGACARLRDRSDTAHEVLVAVGPAEPRMVFMAVAAVVVVVSSLCCRWRCCCFVVVVLSLCCCRCVVGTLDCISFPRGLWRCAAHSEPSRSTRTNCETQS